MKVFWNILAALFGIAAGVIAFVFICGSLESVIQFFSESPVEAIGGGLIVVLFTFLVTFFPINEIIDIYCD